VNSKHRVREKVTAWINYYMEKQWSGFNEKLMVGSDPNMAGDAQMPIECIVCTLFVHRSAGSSV